MPVSGQIGPAFESTFLIDADNVIGQRGKKKRKKERDLRCTLAIGSCKYANPKTGEHTS